VKISELSTASGVPVASVKFYLREGLLSPGVALNARESAYDESHLRRLRLIRGLIQVAGTSIEQIRQLLEIIETPDQTAIEVVGRATAALSSRQTRTSAMAPEDTTAVEALLDRLGVEYVAGSANLRMLAAALDLADQVGLPSTDEQLAAYVRAARETASADFARVPWNDPQQAAEWAVLGTVLYEPVLTALRRLAHSELAEKVEWHGSHGVTGRTS
jgi:DNA-binding transcriptional MerR regulator